MLPHWQSSCEFSLPWHAHGTGSFVLLSSVSVAEIILENYKTCEQLQAIILAFILIVNFYDKMILVPVHQCFCSQGSNIRILPSGSFSRGELIMILALVRE